MNQKFPIGLMLAGLLTGCMQSVKYPVAWAEPHSLATGNIEQALVGDFYCIGTMALPQDMFQPAQLAFYFDMEPSNGNCHVIHIERPQPGVLMMVVYSQDRVVAQQRFLAGEHYRLKDGMVAFKPVLKGINQEGVLAVETTRRSITRSTADDLIIKASNNGIGLMFFIPAVGGSQYWVKFERTPCTHS